MNILGISSLDNVSSASLVCDGRIVAALAEERLTRVKLQHGFPARAVSEVLRIAGLNERHIDAVAYPFYPWQREARAFWGGFLRNTADEIGASIGAAARGLAARGPAGGEAAGGSAGGEGARGQAEDGDGEMADGEAAATPKSSALHLARYAKWCVACTEVHSRFGRELDRELARRGWSDRLHRVEHHQAHAASAYLTAGVSEALILTLDWYGGGLAGSISVGRPSGIERLRDIPYPHSLGMFYAYVTAALGFKPARHEGKIVGLAAFGDPSVLYRQVRDRVRVIDGDLRFRAGMDYDFVRDLAARHPREEVAAAFQKVLEDVTAELVEYYVRKTGLRSVVLAGGVAANVKMNQRVYEVPGVEHVFVHPAMGDEGTGTGAALDLAFRKGELQPFALDDVYLGPAYSALEMRFAMESAGLRPVQVDDVEVEVARRIAGGQVVAHFDGRMEYGPRALGNRSILYEAKDPSVNQWLNHRLNRTEFMPFAPATLIEEATRCYIGIEGAKHAARFMTITFDCTEEMKRQSPAAVHIDGTARPQLVDPVHSPRFHKILKAYREITGIPSVINTSFNMHEEPIVCTPEDAVRAFVDGRLDVLVMGDFIAERRERAGAGMGAGA